MQKIADGIKEAKALLDEENSEWNVVDKWLERRQVHGDPVDVTIFLMEKLPGASAAPGSI